MAQNIKNVMAENIKNVLTFSGVNGRYTELTPIVNQLTPEADFITLLSTVPQTLVANLVSIQQFQGGNIYLINMIRYNQSNGDETAKYLASVRAIGTY